MTYVLRANGAIVNIRKPQWRSKGGGDPGAARPGGGKIEAIPKNLGRENYFQG